MPEGCWHATSRSRSRPAFAFFVVMDIGSRRILHCNVTPNPTAEWTMQQLREAIPSDHEYRYLIHDRHATFSAELDATVASLGLKAVKTPVRAPQANAFCERLIGTMRRECLDFMIPLSDRHLRAIVREWVSHYNRGRPHSRLGPGIPDQRSAPRHRAHRHCLEREERVTSTSVLGGLHHEICTRTNCRLAPRYNFCRRQGRVSPCTHDFVAS
jgi:putative transposase